MLVMILFLPIYAENPRDPNLVNNAKLSKNDS
jgi:hypothetical protein